jgi:hypothetical protein
MAVDLTLKGTGITNRDATPVVMGNPGAFAPGILREVNGYLASVTASLSTTSIIRLVEVPSNAIVSQVLLYSEAQTAGAFDIGVYRNTRDGGAVVSAAFFASAVSCAAAIDGTDVTNESGTNTIDKRLQPLWQAAGASVDPKSTYDIALTCATTAVTTGTGKIGLKVRFSV